ncbi:gliding motility-associated C-terminal domain-containing protein [Pontibacter silvestris]|uniref:Gliding motility-associated C-terminal domain-containing protein n=1 Tax=Pontibacter silvestris TaxID=2305183 RepID=A0ABW4WSR5_9BACT|nr:gliding motility-associated C-terminal domain-containing protein [Pontibacter silvestris]MCC9138419.1 gliding motility-associated C-terminal domain-containing protein [Pontibacter silvestris]
MRLRLLLLFLFLISCARVSASHLAGGDFELQHQQGYNYRLILNLYFDEINGNPNARDPSITVKIFEKGTNKVVRTAFLPLRSLTSLNYANIACTTGELKTSKLIYYQDIMLEPETFNHPDGYYVVWERCCRNGSISNIASPSTAGQTFYMEFPAVAQNGKFFQNSSPVLSAPISDYACVGEEFSYNFASTDPDGDEVVYDLVTPLNGNSSSSNPLIDPLPGPYPEVPWLPGYSTNNQIIGTPPLAIDRSTGRLTVTPSFKGLFIFGIRYQEFRDGVKIGEVRRDFQLLVKDCPKNNLPIISAQGIGGTGMYKEGEVLHVKPEGPRCFQLFLTDPDKNENLSLKVEPVNFTQQGYSLSGQTSGTINTGVLQDTLTASICFDECFDSDGKTYLMNMIVSDFGDNGCGLPKRDTVSIGFIVEPAPDQPPALSFSNQQRVFELYDGDDLTFDVTGTDPDNDQVTISLQGDGFDMNTQNVQFQQASDKGRVTAPFNWPIDCRANQAPTYRLKFTATSVVCGKTVSRSETIEVRIKKRTLANNIISSEQVICYGKVPATLVGSLPAGGNGSYKYVWEVSTTNSQTGFNAAPGDNTSQSFSPPALMQTSWFRRVSISGSCDELEHTSTPVKITVNPLPDLPMLKGASICPDATASLQATSSATGVAFEWYDHPAGGNLLHRGPTFQTPPLVANTLYYVQTINSSGCVSGSRAEVTVEVQPSTADAGKDSTIIQGKHVVLRAKGGITYQWSPTTGLSDPSIPNPIATPQKTTTYRLTVSSATGCVYTDEVTITVLPRIRPADAITFNGDGINDTWYIKNIEYYPQCTIQVFTRWGAKVFESVGYGIPWDGTDHGKELPMAAYYYIIKLDSREKPVAGSITLIK